MNNIGDLVLNILIKVLNENKIAETTDSLSDLEKKTQDVNRASDNKSIVDFLESLKSTSTDIADTNTEVADLDTNMSGLRNTLISFAAGGIAGVVVSLISNAVTSLIESSAKAKINIEELFKKTEDIANKKASLDKLNQFYYELTTSTDRSTSAQDKLQNSLSEIAKEYPAVVTGVDKYTGALETNREVIEKIIQKEKEYLKIQQERIAIDLAKEFEDTFEDYQSDSQRVKELTATLDDLNKRLIEKKKNLQSLNPELEETAKKSFDANVGITGLGSGMQSTADVSASVLSDAIRRTNDDLIKANSNLDFSRNKIDQLIDAFLRSGTIVGTFIRVRNSVYSSADAVQYLQHRFTTMSAATITNLMGVSSAAKNLTEVLRAIALAQNLMKLGFSAQAFTIFAGIDDMVNKLDTVPPAPKGSNYSAPKGSNAKDEAEQLKTEIDELNEKLSKEKELLALVEKQSGVSSTAYAEQSAVIEKLTKRLDELNQAYNPISLALSELAVDSDALKTELLQKAKEYEEQVRLARLNAAHDIDRLNAELIADEHLKRLELIRIETEARIRAIRETEFLSDEDKAILINLTNKKAIKDINSEDEEKRKRIMRESISLAQSLVSVLNLGADTFAAKFINTLQQAYNIVIAITSLLQLIGGGFNPFGFLFGGSSGGSGSSGGGAAVAGGMPSPNSNSPLGGMSIMEALLDFHVNKFSNVVGNFNSFGKFPSIVDVNLKTTNIEVRGDKLRIALDRSDKKNNRYKS